MVVVWFCAWVLAAKMERTRCGVMLYCKSGSVNFAPPIHRGDSIGAWRRRKPHSAPAVGAIGFCPIVVDVCVRHVLARVHWGAQCLPVYRSTCRGDVDLDVRVEVKMSTAGSLHCCPKPVLLPLLHRRFGRRLATGQRGDRKEI